MKKRKNGKRGKSWETKKKILIMLVKSGGGPLNLYKIWKALRIRKSTAYRHLEDLKNHDLVHEDGLGWRLTIMKRPPNNQACTLDGSIEFRKYQDWANLWIAGPISRKEDFFIWTSDELNHLNRFLWYRKNVCKNPELRRYYNVFVNAIINLQNKLREENPRIWKNFNFIICKDKNGNFWWNDHGLFKPIYGLSKDWKK